MNISFTEKQEKYIRDKVKSGNFRNASEVVRNALQLQKSFETFKYQDVKETIQQGIDPRVSDYTVIDTVKEQGEKYRVRKNQK